MIRLSINPHYALDNLLRLEMTAKFGAALLSSFIHPSDLISGSPPIRGCGSFTSSAIVLNSFGDRSVLRKTSYLPAVMAMQAGFIVLSSLPPAKVL